MNATPKDYCDAGVTGTMTLAAWSEATGITAAPGPYITLDVKCPAELSKRWYDQLWSLSDYQVMGGGRTIRLIPR